MSQRDSIAGKRLPVYSRPQAAIVSANFAWLGLLVVSACWWLPPPASGAEGPAAAPAVQMTLDGRMFRVEAFEKGTKVFDDRLVFKNGTFFSEACRKFGFSESPYYVRKEGDQIQFLAETMSPTHGTMVWKGTVKGNEIDGGFRWTKERWYWTIRRNFDVKGAGAK